MPKACIYAGFRHLFYQMTLVWLYLWGEDCIIIAEQMQTAIAENSRTALDKNEYERRYVDLTERYNTIKADYDKISEQIESKNAQRELFKGFILALEKQGTLVDEFDEELWSSLVQEVVVNTKDDI